MSATLYVGDLPPVFLESDIFKLFSPFGQIISIKVIRNTAPSLKMSDCYAYITFESEKDADRALHNLNFRIIASKQIRVMHFNKARSEHNVIVKNLPKSVDNKTLYDTFSIFGDVISCKVAVGDRGDSKGFGYVCYKSKAGMRKAVKFGDNTKINGASLKVAKHVKHNERENRNETVEVRFTNIYLKNFNIQKNDLKRILDQYGKITSFHFPEKEGGSLGVAFCNYETHEEAMSAINALHGKHMDELEEFGIKEERMAEPFYVQRAQPRSERDEELRKMVQRMSTEGQTFKRNLYVTNIPETYSEGEIRDIFSKYGNIISISLRKDGYSPKQFCYICYSSSEEASIAIEKANEIHLDGAKLAVSYFKSKKERATDKEVDTTYSYRMFVDPKKQDKKQIGGDLFNLVLSMAGIFQEDWKRMGIKDEYSFADKITKSLLERPSSEVRNMMGLGNVLSQNISDILTEIRKGKEE